MRETIEDIFRPVSEPESDGGEKTEDESLTEIVIDNGVGVGGKSERRQRRRVGGACRREAREGLQTRQAGQPRRTAAEGAVRGRLAPARASGLPPHGWRGPGR